MTNVNTKTVRLDSLGAQKDPRSLELAISFEQFISANPFASVRLRNGIRLAAYEGNLPYQTVEAYISAGVNGVGQMLKLQNLGQKSIVELNRLIQELTPACRAEPKTAGSETCIPSDFNIPLTDFIAKQVNVSARLVNAIVAATNEGTCPFKSVSEYVQFGMGRMTKIKKIPNLGSGSVLEFEKLVQNALANKSVEPEATQNRCNDDGFPDLERLIEMVFSSLDSKQVDILLDRIRSKHTLEVVAKSFGLTRERIRQVEANAMRKITHSYGWLISQAAQTIHQRLLERNVSQCGIETFCTLLTCDVMTVEIYFELLKKIDSDLLELVMYVDEHVMLPTRFLPSNKWDDEIRKTILTQQWPLDLGPILIALNAVPQFYVLKHLCQKFGAEISNYQFTQQPRLPVSDMCIQTLRKAGAPLHISDIRAMIFKVFGQDVAEHSINATVGRLRETLIAAPGTYTLYENIPYSSAQLTDIRDTAYACLVEKSVFLSSKILFDRLFAKARYTFPDGFNHYLMMGIVQDDERFITKRGNMVGLRCFNLDATYISLEDEVRNLVLEHGPISIPDIIEKLSETRKLCNDSGIRLILAQTPDVIRVGQRTYDSLHRFFETRQEYDDLLLAIKVNLLAARKTIYALTTDLTRLQFTRINSEIVESLLTSIDNVIKEGNTFKLESVDDELARYREIASLCLRTGDGRNEMEQLLGQYMTTERANKLARYDCRFSSGHNASHEQAEGSELSSIINEFNF